MAKVIIPTIKRILRITEYDLLRIKVSMGNMYMCTDTMKLYYDQGDLATDRVLYNYISVRTINDFKNKVSPIFNYTYYCWEDNSLWIWLNKWVCLYSDTTYPSAYNYEDTPTVENPQILNNIYGSDTPNAVIDNNGLLKDGSVVIRDINRIIKGRVYVDRSNDNLVISSFLGGGIKFLPNGSTLSEGEFTLNEDGKSYLRSELKILNNELYIDYSEKPEEDTNTYKNNDHIYKVYHEGNLDTSTIKEMTPLQVYNKLLDTKTLPKVLDFNVTKLNDKTVDDFALKEHKHKSIEITDLNETIKNRCNIIVGAIFDTMSSTGITSEYNAITNQLNLKANDFRITLNKGVNGSAIVRNLENVDIEVTVDPDKHVHQDLLDRISALEEKCKELEDKIQK